VYNDSILAALETMTSYRSFTGTWGWTGIANYLGLAGSGYSGPGVDEYRVAGTAILAVGLVIVFAVFWRTNGVVLTSAILLAFLALTNGMGVQYLLWPLPYVLLLLRPDRRWRGVLFASLASGFAYFVYVIAIPHPAYAGITRNLEQWGSLLVIASALVAMPWYALRSTCRLEPSTQTPSESG
jgi:hypothetical protein